MAPSDSLRRGAGSPRAGASPGRGHEWRASPASGEATASCPRLRPAYGSPNGEDREHSERVLEGRLTGCRGSPSSFASADSSASARGVGERKASGADRRRSDRSRGRASHCSGVRATAGACSSRTPAAANAFRRTSEGRRIAGERKKCRRTERRNPEASAGVNPAFPSRVGSEAIRSEP